MCRCRVTFSAETDFLRPAAMVFRLLTLLPLVFLLHAIPSAAQPREDVPRARLLSIEDDVYQTIERLQRRGLLLELNPTATPYTLGQIADALDKVDWHMVDSTVRHWLELVEARIGRRYAESNDLFVGAELRGGSSLTTTDRLDMLRPFGDDEPVLPFASVRGYVAGNRWVFQMGISHDRSYHKDPDGISPLLRLQSRNEENYVGVDSRYASFYVGRIAHHWSQPSLPGLFISRNPRSYDLISFRLGSERLSLRSILGELDSMAEDETFDGRAFEAGSVRRLVVGHRIDWRPSSNITVSFIESGLLSSMSTGFSLKYLNPLQVFIFAIDNQPKNDENKGLVGGNLWMQFDRTTINGQLLIDDVDIMSESGEPVSVALTGSIVQAGVAPWLDAGLSMDLVTARTYNTHQTEGQYLYLMRGLATNFSDFIRVGVFGDVYADKLVRGLHFSPRADVLWQGEFDMRMPFPANEGEVEAILHGTPERTIRLSVPMRLQPVPYFWVSFDPGINMTSNVDHVKTSNRTRFVGMGSIGLRLSLDRVTGPVF